MNEPSAATARPPLAERLAANADGVLEQIAREYGVSTFEVVRNLSQAHRSIAPGDRFADIMQALTAWGEVLVIVHTQDVVLECAGPIPPGTFGRGYYNMHGDSPIGGHLKADNCKHIVFVSRPFMGRASRSLQFFIRGRRGHVQGVRAARCAAQLIAEQVGKFDALRAQYSSA